jgi:hypothetical protein
MRRLPTLIALLTLVVAPALAQTRGDLPAVPDAKPPVMVPVEDSLEPQVTIIKRDGATVEEHRVNGKLYKIKVTPENGIPYTLVDQRGDGSFVQTDTPPGTPHLSVPMWVIGTF